MGTRNNKNWKGKKGNDKRNTSLVSPCPVTPSVLPTPIFSSSREVLVDMAKEEWGVDGYGSMKGLIRLRSPGNDKDDEKGGSSEGDMEEHLEVERRLDHNLSRFEMIYPNYGGADLIDLDIYPISYFTSSTSFIILPGPQFHQLEKFKDRRKERKLKGRVSRV
ncbi:unnamed protein product [Lactuca virosa]|uniref:Uncharacterized protein n=1 Tax=Lactuca virosa TaxID=75947 RepID=A0AAU9N865_9ASTR|nr:unnamed protein product [Lactuca virosa]